MVFVDRCKAGWCLWTLARLTCVCRHGPGLLVFVSRGQTDWCL